MIAARTAIRMNRIAASLKLKTRAHLKLKTSVWSCGRITTGAARYRLIGIR